MNVNTLKLLNKEYCYEFCYGIFGCHEYDGGSQEKISEIFDNRNEFRNENKRYLSSSGVSYRSKSECLMAEIFAALGLLFFYEKELILDTRDPDNPIYPDFTILDVVNSTEIYWEHFGKMDDWSYNEKAVRKIMEYQRNGIMLKESPMSGIPTPYESSSPSARGCL